MNSSFKNCFSQTNCRNHDSLLVNSRMLFHSLFGLQTNSSQRTISIQTIKLLYIHRGFRHFFINPSIKKFIASMIKNKNYINTLLKGSTTLFNTWLKLTWKICRSWKLKTPWNIEPMHKWKKSRIQTRVAIQTFFYFYK